MAIFRKGDLVYNVTDGLEWCYVAYCNASCKVEIQSSSCTTTPIPSTTAQSTTALFGTTTKATISSTTYVTIPSSTPSTTSVDCNDEYPPRKNGESWTLSYCTTATCNHGTITKTPIKCPTAQQPICANGRQAFKVYDDNGCCFHYECGCVCSILAQNHYITFDGELFNFKEKCSYYLTLTITYRSYTVVLSQLKIGGTATNAVYVNQKRTFPAFRNSVIYITGTDMVITLEIPEINTKVVYTGSSISIDLPYTLFGGNTEGQCGTCDNSQNNDCRSPNGQVESCSDSAGQWHVPGTPCVIPTTPSITTKPATTTQPPCKPAICNILTSSVFKACHTVIPPGPFVKSCVSDNCNSDNNTCTSLEAYATGCSNEGVCIDWRNATNGRCEHTCPKNKVYKACGTSVEPTCNDRYNKKFETGSKASTNNTKEGCFCPPGTVLFNTVYDTCVASCVQSPVCSGPGQQLVNKTDGCCTTQSC
ncbi:Mucin-5AC, partial [Dissostichus eleginoides]